MQYQVLARKYRPKAFPEVVGQQHIVQALSNALNQNLLHHAYLFTGTRGIGKTTLARIFAKCLNCEQGISATPCEQCNTCQEIDSGRFPDFFEIDAASRTKVEDTRELLDNVPYAPSKGRYKIYLIDEVHMLSGHSFNALLKTLEEPPEHVKFLLATTDPQKLPATVLSRCLQFHLGQMTPEQIAEHLKTILTQEAIPYDEAALLLLGKAANGSIRDSLSLLDQCIAFGNKSVLEKDVKTMLGTIEPNTLFAILDALNQRDGETLLKHVSDLNQQGTDFSHALADLLSLLHQVSVLQTVPSAPCEFNREKVKALADTTTPEDVQLFYQIGILGQRDLQLAPTPKIGFEMTLLRMLAFYPDDQRPVATTQRTTKQPTNKQAQPEAPVQSSQWNEILPQLTLKGAALALAKNCSLAEISENNIHLKAQPSQKPLMQPKQIQRVNDALTQHFQRKIILKMTIAEKTETTPASIAKSQQQTQHQQAKQVINADPKVQQLMKTFDATLIEESITNNEKQ